MKARVLVIGAGQVGTFAARALSGEKCVVVAADANPGPGYFLRYSGGTDIELTKADILDQDGLAALMAEHAPEVVVLSAGLVGDACESDQRRAWEVNVQGVERTAQIATRSGVRRLVFVSSLAVYGRPPVAAITETTRLEPRSEYGRTKAEAEYALARYRGDGLEICILRPTGTYGPLRLGGGSHSARFVEGALLSAVRQKRVSIQANATTADQYLYIEDLGRAIALAALRDLPAHDYVFNVGPGRTTTAAEFSTALAHVVPGVAVEIVPAGEDEGSPMAPLDVSRIERAFDFAPRYSLVEGLADYAREAGFL